MISQFPFFYKVFYKGICVNIQEGKTPRLRDLIHFVCFPHVFKAFTVLGVKEASLHHLTVKFQSL